MLTRSRADAGCIAGLAIAVFSITLAASSPTFWTVSTQADFLKGDVQNLSIDSDGRVSIGPAATQLADTAQPFVWTVLGGPGGTLWAGTGNQGQVLRVAKDGKTSVFFDAAEMEVHALAPAPDGGLFVGTSPEGKIYEVSAEGKARPFFTPDAKYIWALAVAPDGTLYAATGEKGVIYRVTPDGKGSVFYKTNTTNVVTLAFDKSGNLLAGTASPGRLYRIDQTGKAFVVLDSPFKEMHAIRVAPDGSLYAAAFSGTPGEEDHAPVQIPTTPETTPTPAAAPVPSVSTEVTAISVVDAISGASSGIGTTSRPHPAKGAIYHIRPDGLWDTVWEATDDWPFDLLLDSDGSLLVGTGKEGKLFKLSGDPIRPTLLARVQAKQITALTRDSAGRIIGAASNPGKLFALTEGSAESGTYQSDVRDAGTVATWGAIRWRGTSAPGDLELYTRSGNTATPDDTWSPWSQPYTNPDTARVTSPNARYLQWKAVLKRGQGSQASVPVLTSVTTAYLPRNLRPVVESITVHPPGVVFQRPFSTGEPEIAGFDNQSNPEGKNPADQNDQSASSLSIPGIPALGRKMYQKGLQTFVWKAEDENDDRLQYDVYYRREGDTAWKPLKRGLWDPIFVWDTTSVPDGTYYVKVTASDAPSNSPATALVGEAESTSFDIDNTPPVIEVQGSSTANGTSTVTFVVRDAQSVVQRVEYSFDATRWQVAYPTDGIPDSRVEKFQVNVEAGAAARNIIIRATDAMNNVATAMAEIQK